MAIVTELEIFNLPYGSNLYLESYKRGDLIRAVEQVPERINVVSGPIAQNQTAHYSLQLGFSFEIMSLWTDLTQASDMDAITFELLKDSQFVTRFSLLSSEIPCNFPANAIDGKLPYSVKISPSKAIDSLLFCIRRLSPIQFISLSII